MPKYTQRSDGRFVTRIWDGTTVNGRKHYTYLYSSKSSKDLEKKVMEFEMNRKMGSLLISSSSDIYDYAVAWLKTAKQFSEKNTIHMYNNIIETHLKTFKGHSWDSFNYQNVQLLINDKSHMPRTCQQIRVTLGQIGRAAEHDRLIPKGTTADIFDRITLPKYSAKERKPLTDADKKALFKAPFTPKERAFVYTLYYCGLRREEALALLVEDITEVITVNKALAHDENTPYIKDTKTERGNRLVPVPKDLATSLQEYTANKPSKSILFPMGENKYITKSSYRVFWKNIQKKIGAAGGNPEITAHVFRHNYCTMLCYSALTDRTITTKKIAELLGDTEKMVLEVYSHLIEEKENTLLAIENAFK